MPPVSDPRLAEMNARLIRLRAASVAAGGGLDLVVLDPADLGDLDALAATGDGPAIKVQAAVQEAQATIGAARRADPCLCSACRRPLRHGYSIVVAHAGLEGPCDLLTLVVCRRCGPTEPDVLRQIGTVLRQFWPGTRVAPTPAESPDA